MILSEAENQHMRNAKLIREQIAEIQARLATIQEMASNEERTPSDDEIQEVETLLDKLGEDGDTPTGLFAELKRAERFDKALAFNQSRFGSTGSVGSEPQDDVFDVTKVRVPARAKTSRNLKAFKGDDAEKRAYTVGQHLLATMFKNDRAKQWCDDHGVPIIRQAMTGADNAKGGFLVADEMENSIIILREEYGVFRRESTVVPMGSDVQNWPKRSGGLTTYFVTDTGTITASDATIDNVELVARKMATLTRYSSEVGEDAVISIADFITNEIAYAFANKEDDCGFNGDGTSTYGGIVGVLNNMNAGSIYDAASGNTAFSTLDLADFEGLVGSLPQYAHANAKFYIHRTGYFASAANLANAAGGNTTETLASGPSQAMFMGYPVVFTQVLNSTLTAQASTVLFAFGDLRAASMLGNRRGIQVSGSEHRYFDTDEVAIRGLERFDIKVHERGDATDAGAIVVMKTAAS